MQGTTRLIAAVSATALLAALVVLPPSAGRAAAALAARPVAAAAVATSWTEYHYDDAHTGSDPNQPLATGAVGGWTSPGLDGEVFAEPLILNGVVYAATLNNTVYALNQATGAVIWSKNLGTPQTSGWGCGNINPTGILGTPIIDAAANRIYVAAEVVSAGNTTYQLFGIDLGNSHSILLDTTLSTTGFDWTIEQERGALAEHGGYVYVPFGGRAGDCGAYHGYVFAVSTTSAAITGTYITPGQGDGIWAAGGVVVDDSTGNVFDATGNGTGSGCDATAGGAPVYLNDAVNRLAQGNLSPATDFWMPSDWKANWCDNDQDIGSIAPLLINSNLLFQTGKWGVGYLLNPNALGGVGGEKFGADVCLGSHGDSTFGSAATNGTFIYIECEGSGIVALRLNAATQSFAACSSSCSPNDWNGGGGTYGPPIVAGGVVWAAQDGSGLTGFDAGTGTVVFQSAGFGVNRFVTPAEAGGHLYVPSHTVIRDFDMTFLPWTSLGGTWTSGAEVAAGSGTSEDAFIRGTDYAVWQNHWNGTSWSGWSSLGGYLTADLGAVAQGTSQIDIWVRGSDNALYQRTWNGSSWGPWQRRGGILTSGPDAASWGPGRIDVFVAGSDHQMYHGWMVGTTWHAWEPLGGYLTSAPGVVSWGANRLDVFVRGTDNSVYHKWWDGFAWHGWENLGGILLSAPDAASCASGHLDIFVVGTDHGLWHKGWNGSAWSQWQPLGGYWTSTPSAECRPGTQTIDVFEQGTDQAIWTTNLPAS